MEKFLSCIRSICWRRGEASHAELFGEGISAATSPELAILVVVKCCMQINFRSILPFPAELIVLVEDRIAELIVLVSHTADDSRGYILVVCRLSRGNQELVLKSFIATCFLIH
ncbi:hypothetical protein QL285_049373 [Trifolium repens]|nr:hypothetical protein QL285_049373 [Trifolium repens]